MSALPPEIAEDPRYRPVHDEREPNLSEARSAQALSRREPGSKVLSVAFSPDGKRLAKGANDGTMQIWGVDFGDSNLFEIACRRRRTLALPTVLETDGIDIGEDICTGEEPIPPLMPKEAAQ